MPSRANDPCRTSSSAIKGPKFREQFSILLLRTPSLVLVAVLCKLHSMCQSHCLHTPSYGPFYFDMFLIRARMRRIPGFSTPGFFLRPRHSHCKRFKCLKWERLETIRARLCLFDLCASSKNAEVELHMTKLQQEPTKNMKRTDVFIEGSCQRKEHHVLDGCCDECLLLIVWLRDWGVASIQAELSQPYCPFRTSMLSLR